MRTIIALPRVVREMFQSGGIRTGAQSCIRVEGEARNQKRRAIQDRALSGTGSGRMQSRPRGDPCNEEECFAEIENLAHFSAAQFWDGEDRWSLAGPKETSNVELRRPTSIQKLVPRRRWTSRSTWLSSLWPALSSNPRSHPACHDWVFRRRLKAFGAGGWRRNFVEGRQGSPDRARDLHSNRRCGPAALPAAADLDLDFFQRGRAAWNIARDAA